MKNKILAISGVILFGLSVNVHAEKFIAADETTATKLCMTALKGKRITMYKELKAAGYTLNNFAKNVKCNGESLLSFVEYNSQNPAAMLRMLDRSKTSVSITDLAKKNLKKSNNGS